MKGAGTFEKKFIEKNPNCLSVATEHDTLYLYNNSWSMLCWEVL